MGALNIDPRGRRAALYGFRIMRLGLVCVVGLGFMAASVATWNTGALGNASGWASQNLGPHGNSIVGLVFGALFAAGGGYFLLRTVRRVRAERAAGLLPPR